MNLKELKAAFPSVYVNRRAVKNGYVYAVISYRSVYRDGKSYKTDIKRIGVIRGDNGGVGVIEFNDCFLRFHPEFEHVTVTRLGRQKFSFQLRNPGDDEPRSED